MKIVINAYSARLGGGQTYLKNLLARFADFPGIEVSVFAPEALPLPDSPRIRRVHSRWPTTNPLLRAVWERLLLPGFLRRTGADVLFCPGGVVATRPPRGCKVVTMFRNMIPFDPELVSKMPWGLQRLRNLVLRRVLLKSMATADLTIFISDHARALIERFARIPNPVTIPHGISDAFRAQAVPRPRPDAAPAGKYVLYVSRFDLYKHHMEVVRAFHALPAHLTEGTSLVFLGESDMPQAETVRALIAELGLCDKVIIGGAVPYETLPAWYAHADAVLFASSCENCPNILLESMASGRPVLSSNVMPMPEFGGDGIAYFSPFAPAEISAALARVLGDTAYRAQVGDAALQMSKRYDWDLTAEATLSAILALHGKPASLGTQPGTVEV
jgi:glycosyltransferase involved in cell wall biosynthesis